MPNKSLKLVAALVLVLAVVWTFPFMGDNLRSGGRCWYLGEVQGGSFTGIADYNTFWRASGELRSTIDGEEREVINMTLEAITTERIIDGVWIFPSENVAIETLNPPESVDMELRVTISPDSAKIMTIKIDVMGPDGLHDVESYALTESGRVYLHLETRGFGDYVATIHCRYGSEEGEGRSRMRIQKGVDLSREKFPRKGYDGITEFSENFNTISSVESFFYWLRENFEYEVDQAFEVVHSPDNLLKRMADDCDGYATLSACLLQEGLRYDTIILSTDTDGDGRMDHSFAVMRCSDSYLDYIETRYGEDRDFPLLPRFFDEGGSLFIVDGAYGRYPGQGNEDWPVFNEYEWYELVGLIT